ncbi:MAG: GerMN domain-containing protein [Coriobacteriia bacterium]|nr:GerMN domain-containing protein [Coriobacteriia bacterium]
MRSARTIFILTLVIALATALVLAPGCGPKDEPADEPTEEPAEEPANGDEEPTDGDSGVVDPVDPDADDGSTDEEPATTPETVTLRLYWVSAGENALGIERTVPYTKAVATAALRELIAGPTAAEKTTWPAISSAIPEGTELLGVTVANGVAKVDFSSEYASGGGTFSVTARIAQVVYTLSEFPTVDAVEFYINGTRVEVFSSEGLILDGPQRAEDYWDLLPIDA